MSRVFNYHVFPFVFFVVVVDVCFNLPSLFSLPFHYLLFLKIIVFEVSFSQASRLNYFFLLVSALLSLAQWFV